MCMLNLVVGKSSPWGGGLIFFVTRTYIHVQNICFNKILHIILKYQNNKFNFLGFRV